MEWNVIQLGCRDEEKVEKKKGITQRTKPRDEEPDTPSLSYTFVHTSQMPYHITLPILLLRQQSPRICRCVYLYMPCTHFRFVACVCGTQKINLIEIFFFVLFKLTLESPGLESFSPFPKSAFCGDKTLILPPINLVCVANRITPIEFFFCVFDKFFINTYRNQFLRWIKYFQFVC